MTLLAACSDTPPAEPTSAVATWTLSAVGDDAVPTTVYSEEGYSLEVTSGEIILAADGSYTNDVTVTETVDGNASIYVDRITGTWVETAGGSITLTPIGEPTMAATWSGSSLTVTTPDFVLVYTRAP